MGIADERHVLAYRGSVPIALASPGVVRGRSLLLCQCLQLKSLDFKFVAMEDWGSESSNGSDQATVHGGL